MMGIAMPTYEDLLAVWEMGLGPKPESPEEVEARNRAGEAEAKKAALAQSLADREAARRMLAAKEQEQRKFDARGGTYDRQLDKHNPPPGWATHIDSDSSSATYRVEVRPDTVHGGTYMFCPCAAWTFKRGKGEECKHVLRARALWSRGQ